MHLSRSCTYFHGLDHMSVRAFQTGPRLLEGVTFAAYLLIHLLPFAQYSPGRMQNQHQSLTLIIRYPLFTSLFLHMAQSHVLFVIANFANR